MINAKDFWRQVNIGPNLTEFVNKHEEFSDFWEHCERADWMYWFIGVLHDFLEKDERQRLFYKNHEKFWELYRKLCIYNKSLRKTQNDSENTQEPEFPWIKKLIESLSQEFDQKEAERRSWLGADTWLLQVLKNGVEDVATHTSFMESVLLRYKKVTELGRKLNAEEEKDIEESAQKAQEVAVMKVYKEQAQLFRDIIGNIFN